jgi:hypothetical protein
MRTHRPTFVALALLSAAGCTRTSLSPAVDARPPARYGAPVSAGAAQPISTLLANPDALSGKTVLVEGKVRAACTRRGCWMELSPGMEKGGPGCRVTFKDYGFFVPTDSQGADARVEGVVAVRTVPAGDVAHYESEGGSFPGKQPDGTAREVRIVATGVELRK